MQLFKPERKIYFIEALLANDLDTLHFFAKCCVSNLSLLLTSELKRKVFSVQ
jgi:hypothetical protein